MSIIMKQSTTYHHSSDKKIETEHLCFVYLDLTSDKCTSEHSFDQALAPAPQILSLLQTYN
jgi:hypothetical protein